MRIDRQFRVEGLPAEVNELVPGTREYGDKKIYFHSLSLLCAHPFLTEIRLGIFPVRGVRQFLVVPLVRFPTFVYSVFTPYLTRVVVHGLLAHTGEIRIAFPEPVVQPGRRDPGVFLQNTAHIILILLQFQCIFRVGGLSSGKLLLIHGQIFPYCLTVQTQAFSNLRLVEPLGLKFSCFIPHILSVFQISAHDFHKMMSVCFEPAKIGIHSPVKVRHSFFPFFCR